MMATDLADQLVRQGATFREAHGAVGRLVREAEEAGVELDALPPASFTAAHPLFDDTAVQYLLAESSVALRDIEGGTGPCAVRTQLEAAKAALRPPREVRANEVTLRVG
jgi:argininosuccinate lyase